MTHTTQRQAKSVTLDTELIDWIQNIADNRYRGNFSMALSEILRDSKPALRLSDEITVWLQRKAKESNKTISEKVNEFLITVRDVMNEGE